jgi:hypothetical protein
VHARTTASRQGLLVTVAGASVRWAAVRHTVGWFRGHPRQPWVPADAYLACAYRERTLR